MIKAVLFDIDGVLVDSFKANLRYYSDLMEKFDYLPPTEKEFEALFHLTLKDGIKAITKLEDETRIQEIWSAGSAKDMPYHNELLTIPEGLAETIKKLSEKYKLGLISSRVKSFIYITPEIENLKEYFSIAVGYEDTHGHKPDPEPLLFAAKQLKIPPQDCVYIGDVENDVIAAKAAGMKSILFAKKKVNQPNAVTHEFIKLLEIIAKL